jgi:hypothetical protein
VHWRFLAKLETFLPRSASRYSYRLAAAFSIAPARYNPSIDAIWSTSALISWLPCRVAPHLGVGRPPLASEQPTDPCHA